MARAMAHPVAYLMAYSKAHPKFSILPIMKKKLTYVPREQAFKSSDGSHDAFQ